MVVHTGNPENWEAKMEDHKFKVILEFSKAFSKKGGGEEEREGRDGGKEERRKNKKEKSM